MVPRRRALLAALGSGLAGLAGCSALSQREPEPTETPSSSPTATQSPTETPTPDPVTDAAVDEPWGAFQSDAAHTGYAPELAGPAEHPSVNWRTDTWGLRTSPVVADDTVCFVTGLRHRHVHALDVATGEERWRTPVDGRQEHALVAADGTVYAGLDRLYALDAETGETRWDDPRRVREGVAVAEGRVVAPSHAVERIRAFDAATGDELWDRRIPGHATAASAVPAVHDGSVYVASHEDVFALDLETGERAWRRSLGDRAGAAPTASDDRLYVPTERGLRALDPSNGAEVWHLAGRFRRSSPAVDGETLYVAGRIPDGDEHVPAVLALDAATGEERWRVEPPEFTPGSPVVTDDFVYVAADGTRLYALDAGTGEVRWSLEFGWDLATPALTADDLLVSAGGRLYAVGRNDDADARPWAGLVEPSSGPGSGSSPEYVKNDFYFGTHGYDVTASSEVSTDPDAPFEFTVDVTGDRIDADDEVTLEFALTNTSDEPLTVDGGAPAPFEVIRFEERGQGGRTLTAWSTAYEESGHVHTLPHRGVTLVNDIGLRTRIDPGETVRETYTLSTGTHGIQPGSYSLTEAYTVHRGDSPGAEEAESWHPGVSVGVELEEPAPETGDVVQEAVVTDETAVPGAFVGDLSVEVLEPVTETHPGLLEITLRNREGLASVSTPGRLPYASYVGLDENGSRLVLIDEDSFAPAYVTDTGGDGSWVPTFRPHVERTGGLRHSRFEADEVIRRRYLVLGDPATEDPISPGEYVFDQGYADDDVEFRWGFRLSLRAPEE